MEYLWDNVDEEFWTTNCAWCLGIDLVRHEKNGRESKLNLPTEESPL